MHFLVRKVMHCIILNDLEGHLWFVQLTEANKPVSKMKTHHRHHLELIRKYRRMQVTIHSQCF